MKTVQDVKKYGVYLPLFLLLWVSSQVFAQGGAAGGFLRIGVGARAKAMGNAYVALARGLESSYYNPAGLPLLENREVVASYRFLSLDRQFSFIGFGLPIQPKISGTGEQALSGGLALTWIHAGVGHIDGRNSDGASTGELSNSENAFALSFALNPVPVLSVGLTVKVLWNRFPEVGGSGQTVSASGVGFDFGALLRPNSWLSLGVSIKDINSKYTWNTDKIYGEDGSEVINKFPKVVRAGLAARVPQVSDLLFVFDFEDSKELDSRVHFGAEKGVQHNIVVRCGYDDGSLTAGAGVDFDMFGKMSQLNYSFVSAGNRPQEEHVFTWVFQF
ncbi:MAG: hypothetical protein ACE5IR_07585 [bacterium]